MMTFQFKFVEHVPEPMEEGVLYISIPFSTVMHLCPCGCHSEVVTKIAPNRWKLIFNGESVSLSPSIGNWSLPCQSHYWIQNNEIHWAESWSEYKQTNTNKKEKEKGRKTVNWFFRRKP